MKIRVPYVLLLLLIEGMLLGQDPVTSKPTSKKAEATEKKKDEEKAEKEESRSPVTAYRVKRAITVSGAEIDDAVLLVQDGKIKAIGKSADVEIPPFATTVDRGDQVVAPGFVHAASLAYTGQTRASFSGTTLKGSRGAKASLNPNHKEASRLAREGFTTLAVMLPGGGVTGQGALVGPAGEGEGLLKVEKILREENAVLWMAFEPKTSTKKFWKETLEKARKYITDLAAWKKAGGKKSDESSEKKPEKKTDGKSKKQEASKKGEKKDPKADPKKDPKKDEKKDPKEDEKDDKKKDEKKSSGKGTDSKTSKKPTEPKANPDLMPLVDVLEGRLPGILTLSNAVSFLHFEKSFAQEKAFRPALLMGVGGVSVFSRFGSVGETSAAWRVVDKLIELKAPVIMPTSLGRIPNTNSTRVTQRVLLDKGVPVALIPAGSSLDGYRGYRFQLMQLLRHGIPRDQLLRAATLTPAEILGVQEQCGSLEPGKNADLVFYSGDPLSPTARVLNVLVEGESVYDEGEKKS